MESILFEAVTKGVGALTIILLSIWWFNAGCPYFTVTRRK